MTRAGVPETRRSTTTRRHDVAADLRREGREHDGPGVERRGGLARGDEDQRGPDGVPRAGQQHDGALGRAAAHDAVDVAEHVAAAAHSGTHDAGSANSIGTSTSCVGTAVPEPTSNSISEASASASTSTATVPTCGERSLLGEQRQRAVATTRNAAADVVCTTRSRASRRSPRWRRWSSSRTASCPSGIQGCIGARPPMLQRLGRTYHPRRRAGGRERRARADHPPAHRPEEPMADSLDDLREELDDEFRSFREDLGKIREAVDALEKAGPEDDLSALLEKLEDVAKDVRTGGLIGGGVKGHRKALERYRERRAAAAADRGPARGAWTRRRSVGRHATAGPRLRARGHRPGGRGHRPPPRRPRPRSRRSSVCRVDPAATSSHGAGRLLSRSRRGRACARSDDAGRRTAVLSAARSHTRPPRATAVASVPRRLRRRRRDGTLGPADERTPYRVGLLVRGRWSSGPRDGPVALADVPFASSARRVGRETPARRLAASRPGLRRTSVGRRAAPRGTWPTAGTRRRWRRVWPTKCAGRTAARAIPRTSTRADSAGRLALATTAARTFPGSASRRRTAGMVVHPLSRTACSGGTGGTLLGLGRRRRDAGGASPASAGTCGRGPARRTRRGTGRR